VNHYLVPYLKKMKHLILALPFIWAMTVNAQIQVADVYIENKKSPVGIVTEHPRFTWILESDRRETRQAAYDIRVATTESDLKKPNKLLWSSGRVNSEQSVHVPFGGNGLLSGKVYFWQVRVWDTHNRTSKWSEVAQWQMGLLDPEREFQAKWIAPGFDEDTINRPSPYFRKEFSLASNSPVKKATAYITAHGMYESELNGQRVGDACLTPGWTSYDTRLQYQMYDVTGQLEANKNAIGVVLGNGWYRDYLAWGDRRDHYGDDITLLFQLDIEFEDGSTQQIVSDASWLSGTGPILNSEIYDGETYDANKELSGWSQPGYDTNRWVAARERDFTKKTLIPTENEPVRKQETFKVLEVMETPQGDLVADFGQNLVGWVQLEYAGSSAQRIELQHAEVLDKDGNFYTDNLRDADQLVTYILDGGAKRLLEPHFTFQGFRYVKVKGLSKEEIPGALTAVALYSDMVATGKLTTSNELLNQLQHNIQWGQKGNFLDVPTDCPQRDERLGWTGDAQAFFRTAAYNMNVNSFFAKWLKDLSADQLPNGSIPFVVPNVLGENSAGSAGWGDVATIIPWESYLLYGDLELLETQYPSMKQWVEYIHSRSTDNLWNKGFHFGDWLFYTPEDDRDGKAAITDKHLIAQCFYAYSTQLLLKAANVLGKTEDIQTYSKLLDGVIAAFQKEYLTPSGRLVSGTQTAYVLALQFNLLPKNLRAQAAERLVKNIKSYGYHLTTGFLGTPYLNHVLSRHGYEDIAYQLLMQDSYPSWLYPVTQGATTIWERWDGIKPDGSFQTPSMNSYNHYAYGAIGDWMYQNIAGIRAMEEGPGYKHFQVAVVPGAHLSYAEGQIETYYGSIKSAWKLENNRYIHDIQVPVNTTAELIMPFGSYETISEGKSGIDRARGVKRLDDQDGKVRLHLESGSYQFEVAVDPDGIMTGSVEGN
jgi:alpha-L-rhamnosidase